MKKKEKKNLLIAGVVLLLIYLISRSKAGGKTITVSTDFVVEAYRDLTNSSTETTYEGIPLYIYLARNTSNYEAVKAAYSSNYDRNLTTDIIGRLTAAQLSVFVAELWKNGEQVLS